MIRRQFQIDPVQVQQLLPRGEGTRFEGLGYSPDGDILGAATADTHAVWLFRRGADGRFAPQPFCMLEGLRYPHDISFATSGPIKGTIAIAQREGAVSLFAPKAPDGGYGPDPVFEISGPQTRLEFSDAVSFVPPANDYLAVANLSLNTVSFYALQSRTPLRFATEPIFVLWHERLHQPDGLSFSHDGKWLATANHGGGTLTLFRRRLAHALDGKPVYGLRPAAVIEDVDFRYPHSVAFTDNGHLVMTNAGADHIKVFRIAPRWFANSPTVTPIAKLKVSDDAAFNAVNAQNRMEGGPKGLAVHGHELAVCSPEFGIKIYRFQD